jgi:DNA-binding transcriptional regulator YdaS (Cro superfamily)
MDGMELIRSQRGMQAEIARGLGLSRAAITKWPRVPAERVVAVEKITGIPRQLLRPDLWATPRHRR